MTRHSDTRAVEVPFTLYPGGSEAESRSRAMSAVDETARRRAWEKKGIAVRDDRVLWTVEEDRIVLWYRERTDDVPETD